MDSVTGKIFLNYRRGDDAGSVGRLFDRLELAFGRGSVFMDVEGHIRAGDDYVDILRSQVAQCDILLAVIGPRWLTITDENQRRRLDNPDDWVRVEIVSALEARGTKRVIPVLVPGAEMPRAEDLPADLAPLARRQAVRVTLERFNADAQGLVSQIKAVLDDLSAARAASAAEQVAAADAQRQREAQEAARLAAVEERGREQRASGMSAEDVRKAEELANWDFIKSSNDIEELRDHLARFPGGVTERYAAARIGELMWQGLSPTSPVEALQGYVEAYPQSQNAATARLWINEAEKKSAAELAAALRRTRETAEWAAVAASTDAAVIKSFLTAWPDGAHAKDAKARLKEIRGSHRFDRRAFLKGVAAAAAVTWVAWDILTPGSFSWHLLNDQSSRTFKGHTARVNTVAFSPNGRTALSGSDDNTLKLWDIASGKLLHTFVGHGGDVTAVSFLSDGRAISASRDGTQKLWNLTLGNTLQTIPNPDPKYEITALAVSPDGRTTISIGGGKSPIVWELKQSKMTREIKADYPGCYLLCFPSPRPSIAFAPNGVEFLLSGPENNLILWNVLSGEKIRVFTGHTGSVTSLAFARDGMTALSGSHDNSMMLWDIKTGKQLQVFTGHSDTVYAVAFSPDGLTAVSGGEDEKVTIWNIKTGKPLRTLIGHKEYESHFEMQMIGPIFGRRSGGSISSLAVSPDGRSVISGSADQTLKLWEMPR